MLLAFFIQHQQARRPFYRELGRELGVICGNTKGNNLAIQKRDDFLIWVRDRVHLLAANSLRVEKIQKNL